MIPESCGTHGVDGRGAHSAVGWSVQDRAGVAPVEYPGDPAHAQPAADAEGQVPDQVIVVVPGEALEEGIVTGGDIALEALGELDGDSLGVRVAGPGRPLGNPSVLFLCQPRLRSRRIPIAQSETAAVELGYTHAGQLPDPKRHVALRVDAQPETPTGGNDIPCSHVRTLVFRGSDPGNWRHAVGLWIYLCSPWYILVG